MISKETRNVVILSFLTILIWILFEVYKVTSSTNVKPEYKKNLAPISSEIDIETLKELSNRIDY